MSGYYIDSAINSYVSQNGGYVSSGSNRQNTYSHVQRQPQPEYSPHNLGVPFVPLQPAPQQVLHQTWILPSNSPMRPTFVMSQQYHAPNVAWW